jgi:hypothetical protein
MGRNMDGLPDGPFDLEFDRQDYVPQGRSITLSEMICRQLKVNVNATDND